MCFYSSSLLTILKIGGDINSDNLSVQKTIQFFVLLLISLNPPKGEKIIYIFYSVN